jgi:hypothetical protein
MRENELVSHVTCFDERFLVTLVKRSLKVGHVSTSTRPSATALPGS